MIPISHWQCSLARWCRLVSPGAFLALISSTCLLMGCASLLPTYGDILPTEPIEPLPDEPRSPFSTFADRLEPKDGYDRLAIMRVVVEDRTHLAAGYTAWMMLGTVRRTGSSSAIADLNRGWGWRDGLLDVLFACQAKRDLIYLSKLHLFTSEMDNRKATSESAIDVRLEISFQLQPGALNYLGRLRVVFLGKGEPVAVPPKDGWQQMTETGIQATVQLERSEQVMQEDVAFFYSRQPNLRLPDDLKKALRMAPVEVRPGVGTTNVSPQ
jgi:hypothetical protein